MARRPHDQIDSVVQGITGLQNAFLLERKVFLGGVVVAIALLTFFSIMSAFGLVNRENWMFLFGPPGLFLGTCGGAMIYFNKSLSIIDRMSGGTGGS